MRKDLKLIIGLGNPDSEYQNTYHNVGFLFVDFLGKGVKSEVYMNESGKFVSKEVKKAAPSAGKPAFKLENLLIVHDDSDIELGKYKLSFGRGSAGHHGVESIQAALKTKDFWRLRIGIRSKADLPAEALPADRQVPRAKAGKFVLKKISARDKKILEGVFESAAKNLEK